MSWPEVSPPNPEANQPITFSVTGPVGANTVTFSIYATDVSDFCDTGNWGITASPTIGLTARQSSGDIWSATLSTGLPAGLYGLVVYAYSSTSFGWVGSPMCTAFRVRSLPVPEFSAIGIVVILAIATSLFIVRHKHEPNPRLGGSSR
jgi:hypothetical protein